MEVDIAPITLETTKTLARLYPSDARSQSARSSVGQAELPRLSAYDGQPSAQVLDSFFAADFIPPYQNTSSRGRTQGPSGADHESYGVKYVRYLHQFSQDQLARLKTDAASDEQVFVDRIVGELAAGGRSVWDSAAREAVLAYAIVVQARIERSAELLEPWGARLAEAFWASRLPGNPPLLPSPVSPGPAVRADELEVAVELLFLFSNWSATGTAGSVCDAMGMRAIQRVCVAVELFTRYARHTQRRRAASAAKPGSAESGAEPGGGAVGRVQRLRVGHKALLLLEVTWRLVVGGEAQALRRIGDSAAEGARKMGKQGLARDALRQIRESVEKYPLLAPDVRADAERLQAFVHPFDGHLTRVAQLGRFGPIRTQTAALSPSPLPGLAVAGSPSTHMLLVDMLARMDTAAKGPAPIVPPPSQPVRRPRELGLSQPPPRAAREAVDAYVACVRMTRSEREYAEWWHRLIRERGMPLSLTLNAGASTGAKRGMSSDVTINYADADADADQRRRSAAGQRFEFCGIVEAEDLPGLELHLDGRDADVAWPPATAPEPEPLRAGYADLYRALFPLLPALCRALVLTAVNWSPVERELPPRPFLVSVGPPQVSSATCLGVVKYPTPALGAPQDASAEDPARASSPTSPLGGSNVKRLLTSSASSPSLPSSSSSSGSSSSSASDGSARSTASLHSGGSDSSGGSSSAAAALLRLSKHAQPHAPAELAARLVTQYAQWQAVGGLLMRVMLGLQANHVLQADYMAQLLMNENLIPAFFWWLGTANLDLCVELPPAIRAHTFMAAYGPAVCGGEWAPAVRGLYDCMRVLRRLTSHNGLRKGLLYKNKALYFYARLLRLPHASIRQIAAELYRDIMPVVSKKQKMQPGCLENIAHVYVNAPPSLADAFWLADFSLDPQVEMHRHVELLRLLHFYHYEAFGLRLPRDPALFPSLVSQAVDPPPAARHARHSSSLLNKPLGGGKKVVAAPKSCRQSGAAMGEYSWLLWESDLEDTLNDVYSVKSTTI
ncbi:hypothetical protein H4R27_005072 [Coemansia aciculifera]|nr:hypothetical protein H4R27_005072 [Coemansia aciculifera]